MTDLLDRAVGCLLGLACGDALGGAVEFRTRENLDRSFPDGVREITGGGPHRLEMGEYTDDTEMALAIAHGCTADGIDLDAVAGNFVTWYRSGPKDIGIATSQALELIAQGVPWQEAGERLQRDSTQGVAGNGTVMRCAPLALRFRSNPQRLRWSSIETSRMTHADPRATWGAVALNQGIVHLLDGADQAGLLDAAVNGIADERVVDAIVRAPGMKRDDVVSGGYVLDTLNAAFWSLLTTESAEEAIVRAVSLGSDADTTGAVTGALAGTLYGAPSLPAQWLDVLHNVAEIRALAIQLIAWDA
ncbi:MAG: ADP-ribosylglycohydrolase family protein [Chloroflexota bacterium]|nr:ADP-ribosylglycohydrolase family protein [Chloroflexota bacterium]